MTANALSIQPDPHWLMRGGCTHNVLRRCICGTCQAWALRLAVQGYVALPSSHSASPRQLAGTAVRAMPDSV